MHITNEIGNIKNITQGLTDYAAFERLILQYYYFYEDEYRKNEYEINECVTNGKNDGGIDFVYWDDDNSKVILGQCKYSENFDFNGVVEELGKMYNTYRDFQTRNTGKYNEKLKSTLQNALDALPDEDIGNIEFAIFTTADLSEDDILNGSRNAETLSDIQDQIKIYAKNSIINQITQRNDEIEVVDNYRIRIDSPNNYLKYETENIKGILVNLSSNSLIEMHNKYVNRGLFNLNIRRFVTNKTVDEGIKNTLQNARDKFWFYNNGITIACSDFEIDGNMIDISGFSIVNGGQTTVQVGKHTTPNADFFIPCKIISINDNNEELFTKIAETTNSQKPISPRDLKSNQTEMRRLQRWLGERGINLEIKRGVRLQQRDIKLKNDDFGQLMLSFVYQQPGTARSNKKQIFNSDEIYKRIFKSNYEKDENTRDFIVDLIKLNKDYNEISKELLTSQDITPSQKNILSNGKCILMALFGITYYLVNTKGSIGDLHTSITNSERVKIIQNVGKSAFISNYRGDDYMNRLRNLIKFLIGFLDEIYESLALRNSTTSVSNLFKTDKKYREQILSNLITLLDRDFYRGEFNNYAEIFRRRQNNQD